MLADEHLLNRYDMLATNIAGVRTQITAAAKRSGHNAAEITLVAVSKTQPLEMVKIAYNLGVTHFGENRIQEALIKCAAFSPTNISWHMIGHLQSNKAGKAIGAFACIHSVDSLQLAKLLNRHAEQAGIQQAILLQVNVSGELSKEGMAVEETIPLARQIVALPHLDVQGLMTIAPLVQNAEEVRPVFRQLRHLRDQLQQEIPDSTWQHLSMGMTDDFQVAIEEGATIVRVGRAIFGERTAKGLIP
jgi:pyridoxal phosphate enzyme (YggS family)